MDESHFKALNEISQNSRLSQRDLAMRIGLSVGRVNYIVKSLVQKGYIKALRFKNSKKKLAYMYVLTPIGIRQRIELAHAYIALKKREYARLQREIENLQRELETISSDDQK